MNIIPLAERVQCKWCSGDVYGEQCCHPVLSSSHTSGLAPEGGTTLSAIGLRQGDRGEIVWQLDVPPHIEQDVGLALGHSVFITGCHSAVIEVVPRACRTHIMFSHLAQVQQIISCQ